jgi:hypothetical protein
MGFRPGHALLKRGAIGLGKRIGSGVSPGIDRRPQQTLSAQNLEKLAGHERVEINHRLIFNPDMLGMGSGKNQQRPLAQRGQLRV